MKKVSLLSFGLCLICACGETQNRAMPPNDPMPPFRDRIGKIFYAASTPCQAGDYSM